MSKKIMSVLVCLMLAFSCAFLTACGGSKKTNTATEKEKQTAQWLGEHGYFDSKKSK